MTSQAPEPLANQSPELASDATREVEPSTGPEPPSSASGENTDAAPGFAPSDPTDGRPLLQWETAYPLEAKKAIRNEAIYLAALLTAIPLLVLALWLEAPKSWLGISEQKYPAVAKYAIAWLSGALGGTLFDLKWLYHAVARKIWHVDRRLWRIFTPHISGGLSFAVTALISSDLLQLFDGAALNSLSAVVGLGFLVGYFSDSAIAKLTELAETLFGARAKPKGVPADDVTSGTGVSKTH